MSFPDTASWLKEKLIEVPDFAIILGTGLNNLADYYTLLQSISYQKIPGFVHSTAPSHKGNLLLVRIGSIPVLMFQGRFHFYEGYQMEEVVFPIRVLAALGIKNLIVTNASGSLKEKLGPGTIVQITDHINFMGTNPLIGKNVDEQGERFPSLNEPYDPAWIMRIKEIAQARNITIEQGIYVGVTGPSLETKAECAMMACWGADLVGMSTVPEVITARHCGIRVLAFSIVTNYSNLFHNLAHSQEEIEHNAAIAGSRLRVLIEEFLSTEVK